MDVRPEVGGHRQTDTNGELFVPDCRQQTLDALTLALTRRIDVGYHFTGVGHVWTGNDRTGGRGLRATRLRPDRGSGTGWVRERRYQPEASGRCCR
jgi:hypothetical protein